MFIYPLCALDQKLNIVSNEEQEEYSEMLRKDHMRYLKAPFCINVMSGGQYGNKWNISFGGISKDKKYMTRRHISGESADGNMIFPDEWGIKMHQHDYYEFMYVLEGQWNSRLRAIPICIRAAKGV